MRAEAEEQQRAELKRMEEEATASIELERIETERVRLDIDKSEQVEKDAKPKDTLVKAENQGAEANAANSIDATDDALVFTSADVRIAAARSENNLLAQYISASPEMIDASDRGGWRPIHEAVRAGNLIGVQILVAAGCDLTSRTGRTANGGTALWWAIQRFGEDHTIVQLLRSHGALEAGPTT
jgi:ankyrin repeat protein